MKNLLPFLKNYRKEIILGPFFKFLEAVFELVLPVLMARLIDNGISRHNQPYIVKTAGLMFTLAVIGLLCVIICQYYASIASQGFGTDLRKHFLEKINSLSFPELNQLGAATLVTRMTNDINQLQLSLAMLVRLVIRAPFLSIGSVFMAFYINQKLAWIFVIVLPLFCLLLFWLMRKMVPLYQRVQLKMDQLNRVIQESLSGVRVIRAFGRSDFEQKQMNEATNQLAQANIKVTNLSTLLNPMTNFIMNAAIMALLYFGGQHVQLGQMKQGEVLALINYMIQMLLAMIVVANLVTTFTKASASAKRVNEVLNLPTSIHSPAEPINFNTTHPPSIDCQHVSFAYNQESGSALQTISFHLPAAESLGIIGPTGSGKSTLLQLLPRFYDATEGSIYLNGVPIKAFDIDQLRQHIAIVPQENVLFTGTIRENLQWGKADATDDECWQALEIAQCVDFVSALPHQLDTLITEGGKNFSGGQKQRLTIARAIIKKPLLLLLDDSLSALDYKTDLHLRQALKNQLQHTTLIIVSQRVSSIQNLDHILVLAEGKQVGFGTHETLLQTVPIYQEIVASQAKQEDPADED